MARNGMMLGAAVRSDVPDLEAGDGSLQVSEGLSGRRHSLRLVAFVLLVTAYLALHFLTLARSPLPWFDDTFYASITDSVVRTGELKLRVGPLWFDKPVYIYGPAYFAVTGVLARLSSFDVFTFRLPCLVFALGIIVLVRLILRSRKVARETVILTCVLLALDPTFYKSSHSGRMDSMTLFFILLSLLTMPPKDSVGGRASVGRALGSGVAATIAMLTTPRPAFLVAAIGCILVYRVVRERSRVRWTELLVWGGTLGTLYGIWLLYAFGTPANLVSYYAGVPGDYLGGMGVRLVHVPVLIAVVVLAVAVGDPRRMASELMFFVAVGIGGFYLVVREPGLLYSFFMVVVAYLGIGYLGDKLAGSQRRALGRAVLLSLLVVDAASYLARNAYVLAQWQANDSSAVDRAVAAHIPRGSRVVGDDKYFFAVRKAGSEFQYIGRGGTPEERVAYHRDVYHADYLITNRNDQSELIAEYARAFPLVKVGSIVEPPPSRLVGPLRRLASAFNFAPETGYGGTIWARREPSGAAPAN